MNASAAAGLPGAVNGVHSDPEDAVAAAHDAAQAAGAGFTRQCVNRAAQLADIRAIRHGQGERDAD
ncbi:hypothetical protein [Streptomyces sp. NPDC000410]|uniref:hypothetical protein n=1 Tax=Streptomyces sp. NPDC000410 TaxID=3154254 RepID=UPI0033185365